MILSAPQTQASNLAQLRKRLQTACERAGRAPSAVRLLAVSKTYGAEAVAAVFEQGQGAFGENYVQEGVEKIEALRGLALQNGQEIEWHCIGPVQSNKTRPVAEHFAWMQTLDRFKIAQRLSEQRPVHLPPLNVLIQINVDDSSTKAGIKPSEVLDFAKELEGLPRIRLRGLMSMPDPQPSEAHTLAAHQAAYAVFCRLQNAYKDKAQIDTLSMGMSADLELAIEAGSTMVRVGSALFGARPPK